MKGIYRIILTVFTSTVFLSCGDKLADLNVDPNASTSSSAPEQFVAGTGYYAIALEAYFNEVDALFAQYVAGGPGVALIDDERYFIEPGDYSTEWSFCYLQALSDLSYTIENGNVAQATVADILSVHIYQTLVDHYGDIPYSEALKGTEVLTPKYDDAKTIYDDLIVRLDADIASLSSTADALGGEDLIYGGDTESWIRFAYSLQLRILMRQSIKDASVGPQVVSLIANGRFIDDAATMAVIPFDGGATQNFNPFFARREAGVGQFYVASESSVAEMTSLGDPRLDVLYDAAVNTGVVTGLLQGYVGELASPSRDDFSFPSSVAYAEDNDVILMSHWEVFFLRAEAAMRFGTADDETAMFNNAVTSHFNYIGATGAGAYLTSIGYDATAAVDAKSNLIGVQKWISMNGLQESEGYIESKRFDTPGSNIFTNTSNGIFTTPARSALAAGVYPTSRLYPQSELDYNPNTPVGRTITEKVFWDN